MISLQAHGGILITRSGMGSVNTVVILDAPPQRERVKIGHGVRITVPTETGIRSENDGLAAGQYTAESLIVRKQSTWPEASTKVGDLVVRLFRLRDLIHDSSRREVKERFGLTQAEFEVIVTLRTVPPPYSLTPTELRQSMLITPGGLTKVMNNLQENGFVRRKPSGHDKRSWLIELTESGVELAETILPVVLENYARHIGRGLAPEEANQLSELLARALASLESSEGNAAGDQ